MNSLRSHQPNTESLGFYNWNSNSTDVDGQGYLANGTMTCPLDTITQGFLL